MLVVTTKLTRRRIVAGIMAIGFLISGITLCISRFDESQIVNGEIETAEMNIKTLKLKTAEDRITLLKQLGWEVQEDPVEFREITIPEEFDPIYSEYNELQKKQGLNLEKFAGKRVMKYSYVVLNHPSGEENVVATLLIYKNKLIGGDVASANREGFLQGLFNEE